VRWYQYCGEKVLVINPAENKCVGNKTAVNKSAGNKRTGNKCAGKKFARNKWKGKIYVKCVGTNTAGKKFL
jgi:hypothetical protein